MRLTTIACMVVIIGGAWTPASAQQNLCAGTINPTVVGYNNTVPHNGIDFDTGYLHKYSIHPTYWEIARYLTDNEPPTGSDGGYDWYWGTTGPLQPWRIEVRCYYYPDAVDPIFIAHDLWQTYGPVHRLSGGNGSGTWAEMVGMTPLGSEDEEDVINRYVDEGLCTEGWDIFVDDNQVCWG